jgi:hypoxanthine phosphoribosyltransferase
MPKFISGSYTVEDPLGLDCKQAKTVAQDIARQNAIDIKSVSGRNVVVVDDIGIELFKTSVKL